MMAGIKKDEVFAEKISPFLRSKIEELKQRSGEESEEYRALYLQYVKQDIEDKAEAESNRRHWEADLVVEGSGKPALKGMERLYAQSIVIEPTMICAANCRYCLRGNYDVFTQTEEELEEVARYCGAEPQNQDLREVLITGGDPFVVPSRLNHLVESLIRFAPNIRTVRIGSRLFFQAPERIDDNLFEIFRKHRDRVGFEIALQVNHPVELFPESVEKIKLLQGIGARMYSQNVVLKGVNDKATILRRLYRMLRDLEVEPHYLFHCVPMRGMHHLRTSVMRANELVMELVNSGLVSGRGKPMFALMTDIGKITVYEGAVQERSEDGRILLKSFYRYDDRMRFNPSWVLPKTAFVDEEGYLCVWYLDGKD
jgi:lysine 2,3-aminomutase